MSDSREEIVIYVFQGELLLRSMEFEPGTSQSLGGPHIHYAMQRFVYSIAVAKYRLHNLRKNLFMQFSPQWKLTLI